MRLAHKILNRLLREGRHTVAWLRSQVFDTEPTEDDVLEAWQARTAPADFQTCVKEWVTGRPCLFADDLRDPLEPAESLRQADLVVEGSIRIFGRECSLNRPGLWREDPFTHQTWPPEVHFTRFQVFHPSRDGVTDIRHLWEIGRFGWAVSLARAFALTREQKYADAWRRHIEEFVQKNPPEFGPHWLNAMEVSLRAVQWCRALAIFLDTSGSTFDLPARILPSLLVHGRYVRSHLEWTPYGRTNHYLADLAGLLALAVFVPQFRESRDWLAFAKAGLTHEIEVQTDSDGFHSEASTAYHHFAVELYALVIALDQQHKLGFSTHFHDRVRRMLRVDAALRGRENLDPQIGDDDSGALQILEATTAVMARAASDGVHCDHSILDPAQSCALKAAGIHVLRSESLSCHIACGPNGQQGVGGHAHNDKLSVVIRLRGNPLIIDSGTFCYSANVDLRNRFRGTSSHNTIMVDGAEQNPLRDWRKLNDQTHARCVVWKDSPEKSIFVGEHAGYQRIRVIHRRTVELDKRRHRLLVLDELDAQGSHVFDFHLHFAASITRQDLRIERDRITWSGAFLLFPEAPPLSLLDAVCSPQYGRQTSNLCLHLRIKTEGKHRLAWELCSTS